MPRAKTVVPKGPEDIGKWQEQGAFTLKSPEELWREFKAGKITFRQTKGGRVIRYITSVVMVVQANKTGYYWRECSKMKRRRGRWIGRSYSYPFSAVGLLSGETVLQALARGLKHEFREGAPLLVKQMREKPIVVRKLSRTAGFLTEYIFYLFKISLSSPLISSALPKGFPGSAPTDGSEVWIADGGNPGIFRCVRRERFPRDWEKRLRTI